MIPEQIIALVVTRECETPEFKSTNETRRVRQFVQGAAAQPDDGRNSRHRSRPLSTTIDLQFIAKAEKRKQWQISDQIP